MDLKSPIHAFNRPFIMTFFYVVCFFAAFICFYFSISGNVFVWVHPDEETALNVLNINHNAIFGCVHEYYTSTTINRPSGDFNLCTFAKVASLFPTPYIGWVVVRFVSYLLIAFALAAPLKTLYKIPYKIAIIISFILLSIALFIISDYEYVISAGFAIYGTAIVTFYLLAALFPKSVKSDKWFFVFCIIFAINLASHELFLVISGFFIPLYAYFKYVDINDDPEGVHFRVLITYTIKESRVWLLSFIYILCALSMIFAPGTTLRGNIWPTSGVYIDGLIYMLQTFSEVLFFLVRSWFFVAVIFLLGCVLRICVKYKSTKIHVVIYCMLLFAPIVYLAVAGYLFGLTPSLWGHSFRPQSFHLWYSFLSKLTHNQRLLRASEFGVMSRNLFIYISILFNIFLLGFLTVSWLNSKKFLKSLPSTKLAFIVCFLVSCLIVSFHPDGMGSLRILPVLVGGSDTNVSTNLIDFHHYDSSHPEMSIANYEMPTSKLISAIGGHLFARDKGVNHAITRVYLATNRYYMRNVYKSVPESMDDLLNSVLPIANYPEPMKSQLNEMFHIHVRQKCLFSIGQRDKGAYCYNTQGNKKQAYSLLKNIQYSYPQNRIFFYGASAHGVSVKRVNGCIELHDLRGNKTYEHFIKSNMIHFSKGYYYFMFSTLSNKTPLYLFFSNNSLFAYLSWYSTWNGASDGAIQFVFSQVEKIRGERVLRLIIKSEKSQDVVLQWQHGYGLDAFYRHLGVNGQASSICDAGYQFLNS
jgi:hypothetical protein